MPPDPVQIIYDPHVEAAIICGVVAFLILIGLASWMLVDWLEGRD